MLNTLKEHILDFGSELADRRKPKSAEGLASPAVGTVAAPPAQADIRIMLAVLTTGARDGSLRDCVEATAKLDPAPGVELELVLIQNGKPEITPAVAELRDAGPMPLRVVVEPRKGIPTSRNRAILEAIDCGADYIAFIDDDAEPDREWLVEAVKVLRATGAEAVSGPQAPVFPERAPKSLSRASIYQAMDHDPERPCRWAASNNVVFSVPFVREFGLLLNESFTTGGSDKEFFKRFTDNGGVIRWAPASIVREPVVPERLSLRWAMKRSWRLGTTGFQIERAVRSDAAARMVCLFKGGAYITGGLASLPFGLKPGHPGFVDGMCYISHGFGFLLGLSSRFRLRQYV